MEEISYQYDKRRFETFIDAIIAIILTILVLELKIPATSEMEALSTRQQLASLLPEFISYIGSFLLIAGIWIDHHVLFLNLRHINKRYILMNMLFILSLSLVPFTTAFAGHNYQDPFAVALLFVNYFVMNFLFASLYWYAFWKKLLPPAFLKDNRSTSLYSMIGVVGLVAAIPIAYFNTFISFALGILIFTGHLFKKK